MAAEAQRGFNWIRKSPMAGSARQTEIWTLEPEGISHDVKVTAGKPLNLSEVKRNWSFRRELDKCESLREFFDELGSFEHFTSCPVCKADFAAAKPEVKIWRSTYYECSSCRHLYVDLRPTEKALSEYYSKNPLGNTIYTTCDEIDLRIREIYRPKALWAIECYREVYGRDPQSVLDLGAGSGHFLKSCSDLGLAAEGVEIDETSRAWCEKSFGITLNRSFEELSETGRKFDLVTSFNVIEHLVEPGRILENCRRFASERSLSVIETPRYNSITCALQKIFPSRIRGYMFPYGHIQVFSDASFATLLHLHKFRPTHAWYFGQDAREIFFQIGSELSAEADEGAARNFEGLQHEIDQLGLSDLMIIAAKAT
ncbi:MAG: class I SAM-dependent methyltransferase [Deltaproteobacteria bacterium]|nr:class I SAM-dependent methyltransferase [Deltaproteobacteria bacterium]